MGRSTKYEEVKEKLILVEGWCRDGATNEQIAENLGIATSTLYEYQNNYSEFAEALKRGKEITDRKVENSLLKRALGYTYEEVTKEQGIDPETGKPGLIITKVVQKEVVPDTTAQIFWLKNRKPKEWRDKQEIVNINKDELNSLTEEEIDARIKELGGV